ncbi:MAG: hypothetical protein PVJ57_07565 [Phycisphaerae bacterium]
MNRNRLLRLTVGLMVGAMLSGFGGCSFEDVAGFVKDYNPCGTILDCDPVAYEFYTSGYRGPGVDVGIDPACTYPPYCNVTTPGSDPFSP